MNDPPTTADRKNVIKEPTDLTFTIEDRRSSTSGDSSESQFVTTKKKKVHQRSRWNRLTALSIGILTLASVGVGIFLLLRSFGIRLRQPSSSEILLEQMTVADVALHDSPEDCWMSIHGAVYDLTAYAPRHPTGPDYIWDRCGMDGTVDYDKFHKSTKLLKVVATKQVGMFGTTSSTFQTAEESSDFGDSGAQPTEPIEVTDPVPGECWNENQVALHSVEEDCYYILYGSVFDFTDYINDHPGGPKVMVAECGTDATAMYETAKKHDIDLLEKRGGYDYLLGTQCAEQPVVTTTLPATSASAVADPLPGTCWELEQVAQHSSVEDCYYILYGAVFDFTDYIDRHPGGDEVMITECGTDATAVYETAKKHDIDLLEKKGGNDYLLGMQCVAAAPVQGVEQTQLLADPLPGTCWSLDHVAQHNTVDDCYYILYGSVFDFTDYIDRHPGGDEVMISECGTDATAMYETAKKHDIALLEKKGGIDYLIAQACIA